MELSTLEEGNGYSLKITFHELSLLSYALKAYVERQQATENPNFICERENNKAIEQKFDEIFQRVMKREYGS